MTYPGCIATTRTEGLCGRRVYWENVGAPVVLVGEAPGPHTDASAPLFYYPEAASGGRLMRLLCATQEEYSRLFGHVNLLKKYPGRSWPTIEARVRADVIREAIDDAHRDPERMMCVVLLGVRVRDAFFPRGDGPELCGYRGAGRLKWFCGPHPSGRNMWFNDFVNREKAVKFFTNLAQIARMGHVPA